MKEIIFKVALVLIIMFSALAVDAQLYEYEGLTVVTHNYQEGTHTTRQGADVEGYVAVRFDQNMASWSFNDMFTGEPISESMQIIEAHITPSTRSFKAVTVYHVIYECFIDLGEGTIRFRKVTPAGMHNTSVNVQELIFNIVRITNNAPEKSYHETKEQWINRGKGLKRWERKYGEKSTKY